MLTCPTWITRSGANFNFIWGAFQKSLVIASWRHCRVVPCWRCWRCWSYAATRGTSSCCSSSSLNFFSCRTISILSIKASQFLTLKIGRSRNVCDINSLIFCMMLQFSHGLDSGLFLLLDVSFNVWSSRELFLCHRASTDSCWSGVGSGQEAKQIVQRAPMYSNLIFKFLHPLNSGKQELAEISLGSSWTPKCPNLPLN